MVRLRLHLWRMHTARHKCTKNVPGAWRLLFCIALPGNFPSTKIKSHSLQMPSHWTRCVHDTPPFSWIAHASMLEISNTSFYQSTMADLRLLQVQGMLSIKLNFLASILHCQNNWRKKTGTMIQVANTGWRTYKFSKIV
jgi:hypothetical protein